jgi:hypothetical protein
VGASFPILGIKMLPRGAPRINERSCFVRVNAGAKVGLLLHLLGAVVGGPSLSKRGGCPQRQSQTFERDRLDFGRSTLADCAAPAARRLPPSYGHAGQCCSHDYQKLLRQNGFKLSMGGRVNFY